MPKFGEKFENKVQKLTNFQEKCIFGPKKQAGAELKKKKNWGKIDQFSKTKVAGINFLSSINFLAGIKKIFGWN